MVFILYCFFSTAVTFRFKVPGTLRKGHGEQQVSKESFCGEQAQRE